STVYLAAVSCVTIEHRVLNSDSRLLSDFQKAAEMARARRMPQFAQGLGLKLPDALPRHAIDISQFLQRPAVTVHQAKAHFEDLPLTLVKHSQNFAQLLFEQCSTGHFRRVLGGLVFDEIADAHITVIAHRGVKRNGLSRHSQQRLDTRNRQLKLVRK